MSGFVKDVAGRLNERTETLCRKYLSNGTKVGSYWMVGSIDNEKGDSFVVNISGPKQGKWFENANGTSGDMFDLVKHAEKIPNSLGAAKFSAHSLLQLPIDCKPAEKKQPKKKIGNLVVDAKKVQKSCSLFEMGIPIKGTIAETYLANRMLANIDDRDLRFLGDCMYYQDADTPMERHPALLQAIRGDDGKIFSVNRTYLKADGSGKADVPRCKKVTVNYEGYGVALGDQVGDVQIVGEGFETVASFQKAIPRFPALAGLSKHHTSVLRIRKQVKRLILAQDRDEAGDLLRVELQRRCDANGIELIAVQPITNDFNQDHMDLGFDKMKANTLEQILKAFGIGISFCEVPTLSNNCILFERSKETTLHAFHNFQVLSIEIKLFDCITRVCNTVMHLLNLIFRQENSFIQRWGGKAISTSHGVLLYCVS